MVLKGHRVLGLNSWSTVAGLVLQTSEPSLAPRGTPFLGLGGKAISLRGIKAEIVLRCGDLSPADSSVLIPLKGDPRGLKGNLSLGLKSVTLFGKTGWCHTLLKIEKRS